MTARLLVAKFKSYEIMAFLPEHSEGPALLASLFGSDVQAWTRDQVILNDEVQSLITQAHVDKKGEWGRIMTRIVEFVQSHPALYRNCSEDVRPSVEIDSTSARYSSTAPLF